MISSISQLEEIAYSQVRNGATPSDMQGLKNIVIIDSNVANYDELAADIHFPNEVHILDRDRDGIQQITELVRSHSSYALHIIAHGSPGTLYLGNAELNLETCDRYASELESWLPGLDDREAALPPDSPTLLLYACNVAAGEAGAEFITRLENLTHARIAASRGLVGNTAQGGSWQLTTRGGTYPVALAFSSEVMASYAGILVINYDPSSSAWLSLGKTSDTNKGNTDANWTAAASDLVGTSANPYITIQTDGTNIAFKVIAEPQSGTYKALMGIFIDVNQDGVPDFTIEINVENPSGQQSGGQAAAFNLIPILQGTSSTANTSPSTTKIPAANTNTYYSLLSNNLNVVQVTSNVSNLDADLTSENAYVFSFTLAALDAFRTQVAAYNQNPANASALLRPIPTWPTTQSQIFAAGLTASNSLQAVNGDVGGGSYSDTTLWKDIFGANPPIAINDAVSTNEKTALNGNVLLANPTTADSDPDGQTLTVAAVNGVASNVGNQITLASGALLTLNSNGTFAYNPNGKFTSLAQGATTTETFNYTITDGFGGTASATVTVTINGVNDAPDAVNDSGFSTLEDTALLLTRTQLLANDTDPENNVLTITSVQGAVNGTVALSGGNIVFTPTANYFGAASFTYTISDGQGGTDTATVNFTVNSVNDNPTAVSDSFSFNEDTVLTLNPTQLLANDTDPENNTLSITGVQAAVNGTVIISGGNVVFTPTANYFGPASFTYTVSDGQGGTSTATVNLTVNSVNDNPTAANDSFSFNEDAVLTLNPTQLLANDTDVENNTLNITSVQGAVNGTVALSGGNVVFTPTANYFGPASFTYTISDGQGGTSTATVNLTVNSVNDNPTAVNDSFSFNEDAVLTLNPIQLLANDTDVENNTLSITSVQGAVNGTVELSGGNVVFTPTTNYFGPASFTYTISDGQGGSSTATVNLTVNSVNDIPTAVNDSFSFTKDTTLTLVPNQLLTNDTDPDNNPLSITSVQGAVNGTVALSGGNVVFTPTPNYFGPASFTYTILDGQGGTSTATVNLTGNSVNNNPNAVSDSFSFNEDTALTLTPSQLLSNDSDPDNNALSITSVQGAVNGTIALSGGNVVFTPTANYFGPASFTYTISDGQGGTSTATVNLTVNSVNDNPTAVSDSFSFDEDTALTLNPTQLLSNDSDLENGALSITSVQGAVNGTVTLSGGNVVFTPTPNYFGPASFTYTISDGQGGSSTATVNLTVNSVSDSPTAVSDSLSFNEDAVLTLNPNQLLANDTNPDNNSLSITSVQGAVNGTVQLTDGNVVFTPISNYFGPASFTYTISDGQGGSSTATVNLTVNSVNDNPSAVNDSFSFDEDAVLTLNPTQLLSNDSDVDNGTLSITSVQGAVNGTVELSGGNVVFTPTTNYFGPASFTYTISDGQGGSSTATVNLTVNSVNDNPSAVNDSFSFDEDTALTLNSAQLLSNDSDPDNGTPSITSVQGAVNGAVELLNGNIVFTPTSNYFGPASFTYTISDGQGGSSTATVNLTVNSVNDNPSAVNDSFSFDEDTALTLNSAQLLSNDSDPDNGTPSITSVQGAVNGTVELLNGNIVFTPTSNYFGPASFTYTISDGQGGSSTATVNLTVNSVNDNPSAVNDSFSFDEDTALTLNPIQLLDNDSDLENGTLSITSVQGAVNGTVEFLNGNVGFTPTSNYFGPASFTYTISDGQGGTSTATVNLTVNSVNDIPTAVNDSFSFDEDAVLILNPNQLLSNDSDLDNNPLSITGVQEAVNGTVELLNGNVVFTPTTNYFGPASFTYTISDGQGGSSTATVNLTVNSVNDNPSAVSDSFSFDEDTVLTLNPNQLLSNDSDLENGTLSITSVQGAVNGTVEFSSGNAVFTPTPNYFGPASFTYTI
ncbi:tandem-95 repeat protein [Leptolyngbya sp. PL-A3]|uniref:tandem-95 repeat protein n=1 Tax=Leptolyngbya sp. PL-A3 TaxID=2933911 RepID=UPI003299505F